MGVRAGSGLPEIIDSAGIAARLGVTRQWVHMLRSRGELPDPDVVLGQSAGWIAARIDEWHARRDDTEETDA